MAPVAHTGAGDLVTATLGSGSALTIGKPSAIADGDLLLAVLNHANGAGTWTAPSGWTAGTTTATGRTAGVWYKPVPSAAAETAADYTWSVAGAGSGRMGGLIVRVTGADPGAPWDGAGAWAAALGAGAAAPAREGCLLLGAWWSYITGTTPNVVSPPAGMTAVGSWSVSPASSTTHLLAAESLTGAGSTGSRTATASPAGSSALSVLFALAAPVTGAAALRQQTALAAAPVLTYEASATLAQPTALHADGQAPVEDLTASASLAQRTALTVADPGRTRVLAAGVWHPVTSRRMTGGSWTIEE